MSVVETDLFDLHTDALRLKLRALRMERGWTLDETARRSGLSKSFLSRLEDGGRQPSIAALLTLAKTYAVTVGSLFEPEASLDPCTIIRGSDVRTHSGNGLLYHTLTGGSRPTNLDAMRVTIAPERGGTELYQHDDEEWIYVLTGHLELNFADRQYKLAPGDAAHFDARSPHRLAALNSRDAEIILVACSAPSVRNMHS